MTAVTTAVPPKAKSTELYRARAGRKVRKVSVELPPELLAEFRAECVRRGGSMSRKFEEWIGQWLESEAAPPGGAE